METRILPVDSSRVGVITARQLPNDVLDSIDFQLDHQSIDTQNLLQAAKEIRTSDTPVAFPTETVYGLGADATRSSAVKGIYKAKQRPSDNPLIVHFSSLEQLRSLLRPSTAAINASSTSAPDPIPHIYHELIKRFWPGPLTIILPNPSPSPLAPEVTAGLTTFGARIPRHALALALIHSAGVPLAAPSANASTKPSPTCAEHVAYDLQGRITTILDGGPCDVGVESTVVDGLTYPPSILRPGGVSLEQIRPVPGWEETQIAYKNSSEAGGAAPRAPGMKYRHYSPKAPVVLYESGRAPPTLLEMTKFAKGRDGNDEGGASTRSIGLVRTKTWELTLGNSSDNEHIISPRTARSDFEPITANHSSSITGPASSSSTPPTGFAGMLSDLQSTPSWTVPSITSHTINTPNSSQPSSPRPQIQIHDIHLGPQTALIARGIFSALRALDRQDVEVIFIEGIDDGDSGGDDVDSSRQDGGAAAVMNRLRKAAEIHV
jgi:L-threonylcarbamoyladenylate synthase